MAPVKLRFTFLIVVSLGFATAGGCKRSADVAVSAKSSASIEVEGQLTTGGDTELAEYLKEAGLETTVDGKGQVTAVTFRDAPIDNETAEMLGLRGRNVKKLAVYKADLDTKGWSELGKLKQLEHLDLRDCPIDNKGLLAVASSLPKLRSLRLNGKNGAQAKLTDDGFAVLKSMPNLKVLAVDHLWFSDDGLKQLAEPGKLVELYAAKTLLGDYAAETIAQMSSLRKLRLAQGSVTAEGLRQLEKLRLEELDLSECVAFGDEAAPSIGKLVSLKKLNLWRTELSDSGCQELAPLTNLVWLNLDNIPLGDESLIALGNMQSLAYLHLGSTAVTDEGMKALMGLESLKDLIVTRTSVTQAGLAPLRKARPELKIQTEYVLDK